MFRRVVERVALEHTVGYVRIARVFAVGVGVGQTRREAHAAHAAELCERAELQAVDVLRTGLLGAFGDAARAGVGHQAVAQRVAVVAVEGDRVEAAAFTAPAYARLEVQALFAAGSTGGRRSGRGESLVHAGQQRPPVGERVVRAQAERGLVQAVAVGVGARLRDIGMRLDPFMTHQRQQLQSAQVDPVPDPERNRLGFALGGRRIGEAVEDQTAVDLLVVGEGAGATGFVPVRTNAGDQLVPHLAGGEPAQQLGLQPSGSEILVVVVVADPVRMRGVGGSVQDALQQCAVGEPVVDRPGYAAAPDAHAIDLAETGVVAVGVAPVGGGRHQGVGVQGDLMAQARRFAAAVHPFEFAEPVAAVRIAPEVGVRQPQVAHVGLLIAVEQLQVDLLRIPGLGGAAPAQLHQVLGCVAPRGPVRAVDALETVGVALPGFHQNAPLPVGAARPAVQLAGVLRAQFHVELTRGPVGDRGRQQVDRARGGLRAVEQHLGPFQDLDAAHPASGREVVGRRVGVGRHCRRNPVLHDRHPVAAPRRGGANADAREGAQSVLLAEIDARHAAQDAVHVGCLELGQLTLRQDIGRPWRALRIFRSCDDPDFAERCRRRRGDGATGGGGWLRHREHGCEAGQRAAQRACPWTVAGTGGGSDHVVSGAKLEERRSVATVTNR